MCFMKYSAVVNEKLKAQAKQFLLARQNKQEGEKENIYYIKCTLI